MSNAKAQSSNKIQNPIDPNKESFDIDLFVSPELYRHWKLNPSRRVESPTFPPFTLRVRDRSGSKTKGRRRRPEPHYLLQGRYWDSGAGRNSPLWPPAHRASGPEGKEGLGAILFT